MIWVPLADPCSPTDDLCKFVYDKTNNEYVAAGANWLLAKPVQIFIVLAVAFVARWLMFRVIGHLVVQASDGFLPDVVAKERKASSEEARIAFQRRAQRANTMGQVLRSITSIVIFTIAAIMILDEFGVPVSPLIAGAGIVGVAVGFGAQSLVSDFLSGIFMLFEDQYGVGDVIDAGDASGVVEAVGLRVSRLRSVDGTVWYVRNGEIRRVGNMSQGWARSVLDISVAYGEDLTRVQDVLRLLLHEVWESGDYAGRILEEPEIWGVESLGADGIEVRVVIKTAPLEQWSISRALREKIKARFDQEGIEIPFPQRVVWHRDLSEPSGSTGEDA